MFLTIKPYLHLNFVLMLNWIIWNRTIFRHLFTLNWIVTYNCFNILKYKCLWHLNCVLMLNWIVLNRTDYLHKNDLALNNLQSLICHKTQRTKPNHPKLIFIIIKSALRWVNNWFCCSYLNIRSVILNKYFSQNMSTSKNCWIRIVKYSANKCNDFPKTLGYIGPYINDKGNNLDEEILFLL